MRLPPCAQVGRLLVRAMNTNDPYNRYIMHTTLHPSPPAREQAHGSVKPPPASERAATYVKTAILDGRYPGGTLLTEGEIAEALGVSRTPVREALLRLEGEGLLRLYPKKGALVLEVSAQESTDLLEARELFETFAAMRAAERGVELVEQLTAVVQRMRECQQEDDPAGFVQADRTFHEHLVDAAGNAVLARMYATLRDRQLCIGETAMRDAPERMALALAQHDEMLDALRAGDGNTLAALVSAHLRSHYPVLDRLR